MARGLRDVRQLYSLHSIRGSPLAANKGGGTGVTLGDIKIYLLTMDFKPNKIEVCGWDSVTNTLLFGDFSLSDIRPYSHRMDPYINRRSAALQRGGR